MPPTSTPLGLGLQRFTLTIADKESAGRIIESYFMKPRQNSLVRSMAALPQYLHYLTFQTSGYHIYPPFQAEHIGSAIPLNEDKVGIRHFIPFLIGQEHEYFLVIDRYTKKIHAHSENGEVISSFVSKSAWWLEKVLKTSCIKGWTLETHRMPDMWRTQYYALDIISGLDTTVDVSRGYRRHNHIIGRLFQSRFADIAIDEVRKLCGLPMLEEEPGKCGLIDWQAEDYNIELSEACSQMNENLKNLYSRKFFEETFKKFQAKLCYVLSRMKTIKLFLLPYQAFLECRAQDPQDSHLAQMACQWSSRSGIYASRKQASAGDDTFEVVGSAHLNLEQCLVTYIGYGAIRRFVEEQEEWLRQTEFEWQKSARLFARIRSQVQEEIVSLPVRKNQWAAEILEWMGKDADKILSFK